jgi:YegS/Rv2252/BmrU family lipid kinase
MIVVGGDGTLNEVINGIADYPHVRIGFIPGGSGNDFSRGYSTPKAPIKALREILGLINESSQYVDVGKLRNEEQKESYFINNMGAGFDAHIAKEANRSPLKQILNRLSLGSLVYAYILVKSLFTYKCTELMVEIDGTIYHFENAWFVTVSNQPFYGGGMKIAPEASPVDGQLDVTVVHHLSKLKLLLVFITVFWGGHRRFKEVETFTGRCISIRSSDLIDIHTDGEYIGGTPAEIQVYPQVLPIIVRGFKGEGGKGVEFK